MRDEEDDPQKVIDKLLFFSQWIYLVFVFLIIIFAGYILKRVSLSSFDKSAIFIVSAYFCCLLTKCTSLLIYNSNDNSDSIYSRNIINCMNMATDMTVWALIYFFIFEIRAVVDLLESHTPTIYGQRKAKTKKMLVSFLCSSISLSIGYHVVAAMRIFGVES